MPKTAFWKALANKIRELMGDAPEKTPHMDYAKVAAPKSPGELKTVDYSWLSKELPEIKKRSANVGDKQKLHSK